MAVNPYRAYAFAMGAEKVPLVFCADGLLPILPQVE
jgi:hypothetical protein